MVQHLGITQRIPYGMTMAYTTNEKVGLVRVQAIRMLRAGKSTREVSRYFGYAQSTIVKWWKRKNEVRGRKDACTQSIPTLRNKEI